MQRSAFFASTIPKSGRRLRRQLAAAYLNEGTLGARPTLSHVTARQEVDNLLGALRLEHGAAQERTASANRDAA